MSFDMSDRNHLHLAELENIDYGEGKPANQRPAGAPIYLRMAQWVFRYLFQNLLDLAEEFQNPIRPVAPRIIETLPPCPIRLLDG